MSASLVAFDDVWPLVDRALSERKRPAAAEFLFVRDLRGKVRILAPAEVADDRESRDYLDSLAASLHRGLGAYGCPVEEGLQFLEDELLGTLAEAARVVEPGVFRVERLLTGQDWGSARDAEQERETQRWALYSVKGGVGRSTTSAVMSWHLARRGERVLVVDLDLESPGLSSAMLDEGRRPKFGVVDWFVEDLVGQGERVMGDMMGAPEWGLDMDGDVRIVAAHGRKPGEYLEKLGRAYMGGENEAWPQRLARMLASLEAEYEPSTVLLESRSGLHDAAAATVTDLNAQVLLFAVDSESTWDDYGIIFRHWKDLGLADRLRGRLWVASALTPELETDSYLEGFTERSWNLFRGCLYDDVGGEVPAAGDPFSFALDEEDAPHVPLPIHWTRGLAGGVSLRDLDRTPVKQAYAQFLARFDELVAVMAPGTR